MDLEAPPAAVRLAEVLAALSLGIDLGFGQPMEHVLRQCRIALRLAQLVDLDEQERATVYYTALLVNVGCHTDAHEQALWFGDDIALRATKYDHDPYSVGDVVAMLKLLGSGGTPLHRIRVGFDFAVSGRKEADGMMERHSQLARSLGEELGLPEPVLASLMASYERWDGKGWPGTLAGDAIPMASRVTQLAEFSEVAFRAGGIDGAVEMADRRSAKQFDPALVEALRGDPEKVFHDLEADGSWDVVISGEPTLAVLLSPAELDEVLAAIARFVDLKSPYTLGHSEAVAALSARTAELLGAPEAEVDAVRRSGLVSGYGRLGVSNAIWDKAGPLTAGEWERVRLHPHFTERMLHQAAALASAGGAAVQLRERLDGSGYPRGLDGAAISRDGRVLGAADAYQAMCEPRPHREPLLAQEAADQLRAEGRAGRLDPDVVDAVLEAAGHRRSRRQRGPGGLTNREVEVLRLLVLGLSNKEMAARLVIAPKTVGNHVEHIYTKIGASNRAGASLYAMRHGLLPVEP
ncbi:HD domain-containing phosphohydrolase [Aquihabitans sp. McL0605]|uniref:HD domain-containing phosphohydrolase n=1 Tax=Aquihabitans sp. McL0605 TaxID=3415671 RepID=UPI003CF0C570